MWERVQRTIRQITQVLARNQKADGSWRYCAENGPMTDAYFIILLRALMYEDEELIQQLATRILRLQGNDGAWQLFRDDTSSARISTTIEAYYALLASGRCKATDEPMVQAKQFIQQQLQRGSARLNMSTKAMLACTGQSPWPPYALPIQFMFTPTWLPFNFFDFVGYARVHIAPVLIAANVRTRVASQQLPSLSGLCLNDTGETGNQRRRMSHSSSGSRSIKTLLRLSSLTWRNSLRTTHDDKAVRRAEQFLRQRIEPDGTLYSYASATMLMVYAFLGLGYNTNNPLIREAIAGLKGLVYGDGSQAHLQNADATVWNTALLSSALQICAVPPSAPMIQRAQSYLRSRQHQTPQDWLIHNPRGEAGGWGFSDANTRVPDVDDTTAALRAIYANAQTDVQCHLAWRRGLHWVLSMQNTDGGWSAFEKDTNKRLLSAITVDGAHGILTDASSADLTGRTLEFLGNYAGFRANHPSIHRAIRWLLRHQQPNGSWYGRWGICYLYGTWAAVTGLAAVGIPNTHPAIQRAVQWLIQTQNADGGWGESCTSDIVKSYVPLNHSTLSQTAWALDALITVFDEPIPAIQRAVGWLTQPDPADYETGKDADDWTLNYPTGAGLPGGFYIHYHSYRYIWPLTALSHYERKYLQ